MIRIRIHILVLIRVLKDRDLLLSVLPPLCSAACGSTFLSHSPFERKMARLALLLSCAALLFVATGARELNALGSSSVYLFNNSHVSPGAVDLYRFDFATKNMTLISNAVG